MNALTLFAGACGGWDLGLHRAGITTLAACEIDPWRRAQFSRNFPAVRMYADVRELTAANLRADGIGPIDLVCGSPPCQDASTANTKGRGIDGERTGLYMEAVRLVGEIRPRWAAFENVPGIRNRGIDRVLGALEQIGYACWPLVVGALDLGAPHIRKRSWVVCADAATVQRLALPWDQPDGDHARIAMDADAERWRCGDWRQLCEEISGEVGGVAADRPLVERGSRKRHQEKENGPRLEERLGDSLSPRLEIERGIARHDESQQPPLERAIAQRLGPIAQDWNGGIAGRIGMDDGLPKGMARPMLAAYGDAILPQIAEMIGRAIMASKALPR